MALPSTRTPLWVGRLSPLQSLLCFWSQTAAYIECCHMRVPGHDGQAPSNICSHPATARSGVRLPSSSPLVVDVLARGACGTHHHAKHRASMQDTARFGALTKPCPRISRDAVSSRNAPIRQQSGAILGARRYGRLGTQTDTDGSGRSEPRSEATPTHCDGRKVATYGTEGQYSSGVQQRRRDSVSPRPSRCIGLRLDEAPER